MVICIAHGLTRDPANAIASKLDPSHFIDEQSTAAWHAKPVKRNTQLKSDAVRSVAIRTRIHTQI